MNFMLGLPSIDGKYDIRVTRTVLEQTLYLAKMHYGVGIALMHGTLIHEARNIIVKNTLAHDFDYLFFIDSDMVFDAYALERLVAHDKDIVSGLYFHKYVPYKPCMYKKNDKGTCDAITWYPHDSLIEVDAIGMGICLIKRHVLETLGTKCFDVLSETADHPVINGEDIAFCYRAQKAGFKIHVDTGIQAAHQTVMYVDETYFINSKENTNGIQCPPTGRDEDHTTGR